MLTQKGRHQWHNEKEKNGALGTLSTPISILARSFLSSQNPSTARGKSLSINDQCRVFLGESHQQGRPAGFYAGFHMLHFSSTHFLPPLSWCLRSDVLWAIRVREMNTKHLSRSQTRIGQLSYNQENTGTRMHAWSHSSSCRCYRDSFFFYRPSLT